MRRARHLLAGLPVAALAAGVSLAAQAQEAPAAPAHGLRYLSWNGRGTAPQAAPSASPTDVRRDLRRPNRVIPHGGAAEALATPRDGLTPAPGGNPSSLTPASAWLSRTPPRAVEATPQPTPRPAPVPMRASPPAPTPTRAPQPVAPRADAVPQPQPAPSALPEYVASPSGGQPVPAELVAGDPMAPRRDAPIFRMQAPTADVAQTPAPPSPRAEPRDRPQPEAEAAERRPRQVALVQGNPDDRPVPQSARYYSVHRQNGQTPDAVNLPQPTYVDALTITNIPESPATQDLAQPADPPAMIRDAQGRVRIQPAAPEGDYQ